MKEKKRKIKAIMPFKVIHSGLRVTWSNHWTSKSH